MKAVDHFTKLDKELDRLHPGRTFGLRAPKIVVWARDQGWGKWPVRMLYGRIARKHSCDILNDTNVRAIRFKRR